MDKKKVKAVCKSSKGFVTSEDGSLSYSGGDAHTFDLDVDTNLIDFKLEVADKFKCPTEAIELFIFYPNDKNLVVISKAEDMQSMLSLFADSSFADLFVLLHNQPAQEWQLLPEPHGLESKAYQNMLVHEVIDKKKVNVVCKSSRGFVTNKDGSLSYSGGSAYAFDLDGDTNLSNFKLEVAGKFGCTTEAMKLYFLSLEDINLVMISKEEDFHSMLSLVSESSIVNLYVFPRYPCDLQPEAHGMSRKEYENMLIHKGIFCFDFAEWEYKGVVPTATKMHIDRVGKCLPLIISLLMRPIPLIDEKAIDFLTKFKEGERLPLGGLGAAATTAIDKLIETVKEEDIEGLQLALETLIDTYIEAKKCTQKYISLLESEVTLGRLASLRIGEEEASPTTERVSPKSSRRKGKKKMFSR